MGTMKKRIYSSVLLALAITLALVSCKPTTTSRTVRSFGTCYYLVDTITAVVAPNNDINIKALSVYGRNELMGNTHIATIEYCDSANNVKRYDNLCNLHEDMSWNYQMEGPYPASCFPLQTWSIQHNNFIALDITSIEVTSNNDFDDRHPANSSLNDIITFTGISVEPFIASNYTKEFEWTPYLEQDTTILRLYNEIVLEERTASWENFDREKRTHLIQKNLTSLNEKEMKMMGGDPKTTKPITMGVLRFNSLPSLNAQHQLTITITYQDGSEADYHGNSIKTCTLTTTINFLIQE